MAIKNDELISEITEKHLKPVYSYALRMTDSQKDAEEIVKKAFLKTVVNLEKFTSDTLIKIFLYKLTINYTVNLMKSKYNIDINCIPASDDARQKLQIPDPTADPYEFAAKDELSKAIRNAVKALPPYLKHMYVLKDVCGLGYREISIILNTDEENVMTNIKRARNKIKTYLFDVGSFFLE